MRGANILLAASVFAGAPAKIVKQRSTLAVKDAHHVPRKWKHVGYPEPDHRIALRIGLKQRSFSELERNLYEVSDPDHARYGQHLKADQVHDLVRPEEETIDLVHEWLSDNGVPTSALHYSPAKDWIAVTLPVEDVEQMLSTRFSVYRHQDGAELVRTPQWSLPVHLHDHIDTVQPTNSWFRAKPKAAGLKVQQFFDEQPEVQYFSNASVADVCVADKVTPTCLRTLYGTIDYQTQAAGENLMGLCDYLGETNNRNDTYKMLATYRPEAKEGAYQFAFESIANGTTAQVYTHQMVEESTGVEGNLDVQNMLSVAWPTKLVAYTVGGSPPYKPDGATTTNTNEPYLVWLHSVLSQHDDQIAKVISTSYDDDEQTVPPAYARRVCNDLAQLGARGVSVFYSSGDDGVGPSGYCTSNDGKNTTMFIPEFPSTCPYITSVGGTGGFSPEVVAYKESVAYASGGGFSNYFPRPAYQAEVVDKYIASLDGKYAAHYHGEGRAYPDVAAQGLADVVVWHDRFGVVGGTSAAAPTFAAVMALVNDALLASRRPPLGFLNPWLYKRGHRAFTDITSGSAVGCGEIADGLGFPAQEGWDPVTGWGTPRFKSILKSLAVGNTSCTGKPQGWSGARHLQ